MTWPPSRRLRFGASGCEALLALLMVVQPRAAVGQGLGAGGRAIPASSHATSGTSDRIRAVPGPWAGGAISATTGVRSGGLAQVDARQSLRYRGGERINALGQGARTATQPLRRMAAATERTLRQRAETFRGATRTAAGAVRDLRTQRGRDEFVMRVVTGTNRTSRVARAVMDRGTRDVHGRRVRLRDINPGYHRDPQRQNNCLRCTLALDRTLGGAPATATRGLGTNEMSRNYGIDMTAFRPATRAQIESELRAAGPGARGIVMGMRGWAAGHIWNVVNQNGRIRYVDGQIGARVPTSMIDRTAGFRELRFQRTN